MYINFFKMDGKKNTRELSFSKNRNHRFILDIIDRTSFPTIFFIWITLIVVFGMIYNLTNLMSLEGNYLQTEDGHSIITGIIDYVYFSFITATSTGYGDIVPVGVGMRALSIINIVFGVLMMAIVTSKLVSLKQEKLLEQIYHLSFSEKINRLISGLAIFRHEADGIIDDIKQNEFDRKHMFSLRMNLSSLKHNLEEIKSELASRHSISRSEEQMHIEQIMSRMSQVFEKLEDVVKLMGSKNFAFRNAYILEEIYKVTNIGEHVIDSIKKDHPIFSNKVEETLKYLTNIRKTIMGFRIISKDDMEMMISPGPVVDSNF